MTEPTEREWLEGMRYEDKFPPKDSPDVSDVSTTDELGSSPEVSPRKCPSCGCGSPAHTVDCEQADAA